MALAAKKISGLGGKNLVADTFTDVLGAYECQILADNLPLPCWIASANGAIFWFNRKWHQYCGSTLPEMAHGGWQSVHDPEDLPRILLSWEPAFAAKQPFETIMRLKGHDGVFRTFLTKVEPAVDAEGDVIRWIGVHTDISAQLEAEAKLKALHKTEQELTSYREAILAQLAEGVIITNAEGRIIFVNQAANDLHGVAKLDVPPDEYAESYSLFTPEGEPHPAMTLPLSRAVVNEETVIGARWRIRRPDGREVLAIGNAQPVFADNGDKIGAVLTIQDDTARHAAETALAEALTAKEALLFEVNHRVKNSLQIVTSLLNLQAHSSQLPELKEKLKEACARVDVVAKLHQHLYQNESHDRVNLGSYVRDFSQDTLRAFANGGSIDIQFNELTDVDIELDRAVSLALIIGELLTNAIKYAFKGQDQNQIAITVSADGHEFYIAISDNGVGVPDGFDIAESSGFGMRIVDSLVKQLSGSLSMIPQGRGTGFAIRLPVSARA